MLNRYYLPMANSSEQIADLLIHLGRRSVQCSASQLTSAQWAALRFFDHANSFSRQPSVFASYHGTTRGTASQTVKSLVKLGYLERSTGPDDRRSAVFDVTRAGRDALKSDPLKSLVHILDDLPRDKREALYDALLIINKGYGDAGEEPLFGTCSNCQHFSGKRSGAGYCSQSSVPLQVFETDKLCCRFQVAE
jgi:DNA-binding MarR family transcriptional regulator